MRLTLKQHPDSRCAAVTRIGVEVVRPRAGNLMLHNFVDGKIGDLRIPPVTAPMRANELWRHTCLEAFVQTPPSPGYYEFNFAPSTHWAAYRFDGYRSGMAVADEVRAPDIETVSNSESYELKISLDLNGLSGLPGNAPWRLGLSAVIEETSGRISYWALKHAAGKPDFHRADCFAHELAAAS